MMWGLKQEQIKSLKNVFANYPVVTRAVLYGSRAQGNYKEGSDIDLSLQGDGLDFHTLLRIETELDDLLLPYHIDLSLYDKIDNPDLLAHIKHFGVIFYERGK
jgi:predicted nucleotidyltransferase